MKNSFLGLDLGDLLSMGEPGAFKRTRQAAHAALLRSPFAHVIRHTVAGRGFEDATRLWLRRRKPLLCGLDNYLITATYGKRTPPGLQLCIYAAFIAAYYQIVKPTQA